MKLKDDYRALQPDTVVTAIERIAAACQPANILVFGSRARGEARVDSDLDMLIILRNPVPDRFALRQHLRGLLADLPLSKDILVTDPEHLAECRLQPNSVYRFAEKEGVALWREGQIDLVAAEGVCHHQPAMT